MHRRHLNESQRAMVAVAVERMYAAQLPKIPNEGGPKRKSGPTSGLVSKTTALADLGLTKQRAHEQERAARLSESERLQCAHESWPGPRPVAAWRRLRCSWPFAAMVAGSASPSRGRRWQRPSGHSTAPTLSR